MLSTVMEKLDIILRCIKYLIKFIIYLQIMLVLLIKGSAASYIKF